MSASREAFEAWFNGPLGPREPELTGVAKGAFFTLKEMTWHGWQAAYLQGEAAGVRRAVEICDVQAETFKALADFNQPEVKFYAAKHCSVTIKAAFPQHFDSSSTS